MATLQSLALSSPVAHSRCHCPGLLSGSKSWVMHRSAQSSFFSQPLTTHHTQLKSMQTRKLTIKMVKPAIQFIQGTDEQTVPDVKLTKSRDGTNGMAIFKFDQPSVFDSSREVGDITGLSNAIQPEFHKQKLQKGFYMIDEEGVLQSVDVSARFVNGKPAGIEAKFVMKSPREWDRFMRFMERYANQNGLQFVKS